MHFLNISRKLVLSSENYSGLAFKSGSWHLSENWSGITTFDLKIM